MKQIVPLKITGKSMVNYITSTSERKKIMKTYAIRDSAQSGFANMAIDLCSMQLVSSGDADLIFRTYLWEPHCLSIGRFQKPEKEADVSKLLADGYHIVRRPTGGRAVWHGNELTYSLVARETHPFISGTISESLAKVAHILISALVDCGVPAKLNSADRELYSGNRDFNPCFTSHGRSEVMTEDGRKLIGSAQARSKGVFLEHGSIIFRNQQMKAADYLPRRVSDNLRSKMSHLLENSVGSVLEYNKSITKDILADKLHTRFAELSETSPEKLSSSNLPYLKEKIAERYSIIEKY